MGKFGIVFVIALAAAATALPFPTDGNDIASAALAGDWELVHQLLENFYKTRYQFGPPSSGLPRAIESGNVASLKPLPNGRFYAEAESSVHSATNDNGVVREVSGGHKVVNDNGDVKHYDLIPQRPSY